ncbi:DUF3685 domain-containing protein [Leptothoe sp. PORK10 BA2]|uniref:DUF3685 domain-containing protein n=1 Tax=Leptothoe sp. PORK10 BA2 TaxID=3110254 RepID=UPI002B1FCA97|nr:DUF3685 domain-containing protein [Leptothoe sp. PORK10 BA2]MEA5463013.1 DUF3685 domain-containing protein [Leptothoe sp. PORK10 BA2]
MSERPLQLMLVDEDPTFRLGLRVWLEQLPGFQIAAEASSAAEAMAILRKCDRTQAEAFTDPTLRTQRSINLVIVDLGLGASDTGKDPVSSSGLQLCKSIKTEFPKLPVLVLSARDEPVLEAAARQVGANGYGTRGMPVRELAQLIRTVARGSSGPGANDAIEQQRTQQSSQIPGPLTAMRLSMRLSGVEQIEQQLAKTAAELRRSRLTWLERQILAGQLRELKAARWCMQRLWATRNYADTGWIKKQVNSRSRSMPATSATGGALSARPSSVGAPPAGTLSRDAPAMAVSQANPLSLRSGDVQNMVFEAVFAKLQTDLENTTSEPVEIDILRLDKKRELLFIILRRFEDLLDDLRQSSFPPGQLRDKSPQVLRDLWVATIEEFFGRYYTVPLNGVEQELVAVLYQEKETVERDILQHIPLVPDLLAHWLYQDAMVVDGNAYVATTPEALAHSEKLLENLIIQLGNAVMQPLLNRLADVEVIKKGLYSRRMISTRDIERFRNDLSWRYRWDRLVNEPTAIFESQYRLYTLGPRGIMLTPIYAPRRSELDRLSGLPWAVTLLLETRDAISPRLRAVISMVGSTVVYVLTEVVGRGIGLVGRGVLQGIGNAWQDTRRSRQRQAPPTFNEWE